MEPIQLDVSQIAAVTSRPSQCPSISDGSESQVSEHSPSENAARRSANEGRRPLWSFFNTINRSESKVVDIENQVFPEYVGLPRKGIWTLGRGRRKPRQNCEFRPEFYWETLSACKQWNHTGLY